MDIENALCDLNHKLSKISSSSKIDSEILLMAALNETRAYLYTHKDKVLDLSQEKILYGFCERRMQKEPIAYILGKKEFWSREFNVSSDTLIPRPESEMLVEEVLKLTSDKRTASILELGTGSGAIAISIGIERPKVSITATDISLKALKKAKQNAKKFNINNIRFQESDWFKELKNQSFDLIISNPPYIKSQDSCLLELQFEPISALISGEDGLDAIRHIANNAKQFLKNNGTILIEHGMDQEMAVNQILKSNQWNKIKCLPDLRGFPRITVAK
jgi:release factor glutamine methyltransferase